MATISRSVFLLMMFAVTGALADQPAVTVSVLPDYGLYIFDGVDDPVVTIEFPSGDPFGISFVWWGDASAYSEEIAGHRAGWDVMDPADPNDPGWVWPGWELTNFTGPMIFQDGVHNVTILVLDTAGNLTTVVIWIDAKATVGVDPVPWGSLKASYYGEPPVVTRP